MMPKTGWCLVALLLLAFAAPAQVPALLPGRWVVQQIGFLAGTTVTNDLLERLNDPQVADLNLAIERQEAELLVEFRADGTYQFAITRAGQRVRAEAGRYTLQNGQLTASSPAPDGSSFHDQHVAKLTKRLLVLTFPAGPEMPDVVEEITYSRLK
ncbi:MAG: hypothetical protein EOO56_19595 [Hymenobacter sp.]|nr:MAG: hypothetical protein EOO56_19595 [Hymenobacter sp.]